MYRDLVYTSLAKVNPEFLKRLTSFDRLEGFIDTVNDFAAEAHFQIEKQIIDQYTSSEEFADDSRDQRRLDGVLKNIDKNVMDIIPGLLEQALAPGSEMMEQFEREEDEIEHIRSDYEKLMRENDGSGDGDDSPGIILEDDMDDYGSIKPEERLEHFVRSQMKSARKKSEDDETDNK